MVYMILCELIFLFVFALTRVESQSVINFKTYNFKTFKKIEVCYSHHLPAHLREIYTKSKNRKKKDHNHISRFGKGCYEELSNFTDSIFILILLCFDDEIANLQKDVNLICDAISSSIENFACSNNAGREFNSSLKCSNYMAYAIIMV